MNRKKSLSFRRNISRILSFIMVLSILSAYGCNKGKTIDPDFYPTEAGSVETVEEGKPAE